MLSRQQLDVLFSIARLSQPDAFVMFTRTLHMMMQPFEADSHVVGCSDHSPAVEQMLRSREASDSAVALPQPAAIEISSEDEQDENSSGGSEFNEDEQSEAHSVESMVSSTTPHSESSADEQDESEPEGYHASLTNQLVAGPTQVEHATKRKRKHESESDCCESR